MTTAAILDADGVVINIIMADPAEVAGAVPGEGGAIGDTWDGSQFVRPSVPAPEPAVPEQITRAQGKSALIQADLMPGVLAFIASIAEPKDRALAEVLMNDEDVWRRDNPFLNAAATSLGLTQEQIDDLFRQAAA